MNIPFSVENLAVPPCDSAIDRMLCVPKPCPYLVQIGSPFLNSILSLYGFATIITVFSAYWLHSKTILSLLFGLQAFKAFSRLLAKITHISSSFVIDDGIFDNIVRVIPSRLALFEYDESIRFTDSFLQYSLTTVFSMPS